jgi:hypothetical protein
MTLEEITEEIKLQNLIILNAKKRLEQLFVLRSIEEEKERGQITLEEVL